MRDCEAIPFRAGEPDVPRRGEPIVRGRATVVARPPRAALIAALIGVATAAHAAPGAIWNVGSEPPDNPDNRDGKHLQLTWRRGQAPGDAPGDKVAVLVLRRMVRTAPSWHAGVGWVEPDVAPSDQGGAGHVESGSSVPGFGEPFVNGALTPDELARPTRLVEAPVAIAGKTFTAPGAIGVWTIVAFDQADDHERHLVDEVEPDARYVYALVPITPGADEGTIADFPEAAVESFPMRAESAWFNTKRWFFLAFIGLTALAFVVYTQIAKKRAKSMFIRRIPGVDAIEDAIGRSTEMGRPVLYVTGTDDLVNIQTMASLLILGHVAQMTAEYDTELKVFNLYPLTMVVAEEIVRQGYSNAGRVDAHRPENVMFVSSEQFAYAAAINGTIMRDKPATNIFLGRFFAESLLLAESGFVVGAVQIAGTAEFTQLPFFIAACDYTLIGEELYATSAYLTREPNLIAQLKAGDVMKAVIMVLVVVGVVLATLGVYDLGAKLLP